MLYSFNTCIKSYTKENIKQLYYIFMMPIFKDVLRGSNKCVSVNNR